MFNRKSVVFGILASVLAGCASQTMPNPMMARAFNAPGRVQSFNATTNKNLPFTAHFVNSYAPTIAQNEPIARQDPNGPARILLGLIQNARQTLDGAFYDIGDLEVVDALIAAKNRGVRVRIVTDNESLLEKSDSVLDGRPVPPRETIVRLKQNGIPVIDDARSGLMHHKFLVVDSQAVWMGSTNVTKSSLYQHNNNAMVLRHPQVTANYNYEFERMFTQKIFGVAPRQLPFPVIQIGNTTIRTYFSPRGGAPEAIAETLQRARQNIRFMAFSFTDKAIADLMIRKRDEGLSVEGVFDQCLGYGQYSAKHVLSQNKIYNRHDGNEALLHHKTILADNTVITGSFNFSANADKTNNENMLIIENAPELASAYQQEYVRVMQSAKVNNPPKNKCPGDKPPTPANPAPVTEAQP